MGWSVGRRGVLVGMVCWLVGVHDTPARQPTNRTYQQTTQPTHTPSSQSARPKQPRQSHHPAKPHTHTNQPQTRANTIRAPCPKSMSGNGPRSGGNMGVSRSTTRPHRNETPHRPPPPPRLCARRLWSCKNERGTLAFRARFQSRKNAIQMRRQLVSHECSEIVIARWFRDCLTRVLTTQIAPSGPHATRPTPCSAPRRGCVVLPSSVLSPCSRPWRQQSCWWC